MATIDKYHIHEALDRANIVQDFIESTLVSHPVIEIHQYDGNPRP